MKRMTLCILSGLSMMVFCSVSLAVELTYPEKVPSTYAKVVEKEGKKVIEFGNDAIAYEPKQLDQILAGYELTLGYPERVPSTYAKAVEKEGKKVIEFGNDAIAYDPKQLDKILAGYGLTLLYPENVPSTYAKAVEKEGKKVIEFGNDAISYEPEQFNKILAGYDFPSVRRSRLVTRTGTVQAIDLDKRLVTLKGSRGNEITVYVTDRAKNLPQLKVGDQVTMSYYEELALRVVPPGQAAPAPTMTSARSTAEPGEKPGGVEARETTVTVTIEAIDKNAGTVTFKGPAGNSRTVKAADPKNLELIKVGDPVEITYTEAFAVSVEPAM